MQNETFPEKLKRLAEPLAIDSVEFRVQSISNSGWATLLAYKDARVDMERLDGVFPGLWQRKHADHKDNMYCAVGIWNPDVQSWIWREDAGAESNTEAVKGEASDSFKRACVNWGIGRELYSFPLILVQLNTDEILMPKDGTKDKPKASYKLELKNWVWHCERSDPDEHGKTSIKRLSAVDQHGSPRFQWPRGAKASTGARPEDENQDQQQPSRQPAQGAKAPTGGAEKPWYDSFDEHKEWMQGQFKKGIKSEAIITKLKESYKVNRKTESQIKDLAVATLTASDDGSFPDESVPF